MNDNFVNERNYFFEQLKKKLKNGSFTSDERTKWKNYSRAHLYITTTQITENLQQRPDLTTQLNYVDLNKFLLNLNRFRREVVEMSWHKLFLASTKSDLRNVWLELTATGYSKTIRLHMTTWSYVNHTLQNLIYFLLGFQGASRTSYHFNIFL